MKDEYTEAIYSRTGTNWLLCSACTSWPGKNDPHKPDLNLVGPDGKKRYREVRYASQAEMKITLPLED